MPLRHLLHNWLGSTARGTVEREVRRAAAEQMAKNREAAERAGDDDPSCDVGVLFALEIEAGGLVDLLEGVVTIRGKAFTARRGLLHGRRVVVVTSGAGRERATAATESLIAAHRPKWVISAGFAGGLVDELRRHDIVMADRLAATDGRRFDLDLKVDPATLAAGVHTGTLLTTEKVVRRPEEKRALGERFDAVAVDTETMAVAEVCRGRHVPMLAVRILTDAVDETLPADIQHLTDQRTTAGQLGAALGAVWRRPKSVKDLWALKETALVGSDRLAKFLAGVIEALSP